MHWARLEASALGSLIAACPAWTRREEKVASGKFTSLVLLSLLATAKKMFSLRRKNYDALFDHLQRSHGHKKLG